jgi:O-antigen/teichoic acid export membrane protein
MTSDRRESGSGDPAGNSEDPGALRSSGFFRRVLGLLFTRFFQIGLGILMTPLIAPVLGPTGKGLLAIGQAVAVIAVQFGILGLHSSLTYYVASDRKLLPSLLGTSLVVAFGLGGAIAAGLLVVCASRPDLAPLPLLLLLPALATIPFRLAVEFLRSLLFGIHDTYAWNVIDISLSLIGATMVLALLWAGHINALTMLVLELVAAVLAVLVLVVRLKSHIEELPRPSLRLLGRVLPFGLQIYVACLLMYLVLRIDMLMLRYLLPEEVADREVGFYSVAVGIGDFLGLGAAVVVSLLFPALSALTDPTERWRAARKVLAMTAGITAAAAVVLALLSDLAVRLLYGAAFLPAVPAVRVLLPGVVLLAVNSILMAYFSAAGMVRLTIWVPGVALVVNVLVNLVVIPRYGCIGAAWASDLAYGVMLALSLSCFLCDPAWRRAYFASGANRPRDASRTDPSPGSDVSRGSEAVLC